MLFNRQVWLLVALANCHGALASADPKEDIDLHVLDSYRPHAVVVNSDTISFKSKRDTPAEIAVSDSDTIPVEDLDVDPKAHAVSTTSTGSSGVSGYSTAGSKVSSSKDNTKDLDNDNESEKSGQSPFLMAISMIAISEIGDKTFLISALMAMRHSRTLVFSASFTSLAFMTILSGIVGHVLPTLISQRVTQFMAAILFVVFGIKLTKEGLEMSKDLGVEEELAEVEDELTINDRTHEMDNLESGGSGSSNRAYNQSSSTASYKQLLIQFGGQAQKIASTYISPLWVQVFVMIFLGEWGDRSQIATIAMAAGSDYWAVICGAVVGHGICTFAAVVGGKMLASRISMRTVTLGGAFAFFVFSITYFYDAYYGTSE